MSPESTVKQSTELPDGHWLSENEDLVADEGIVKALSKYETQEDANKAHVELMKKLGKATRLPETLETMNEQERSEFDGSIAKLYGVPETPEGYDIKRPELPEGMVYNEELEKKARLIAHNNKIPQVAMAGLIEEWNKDQIATLQIMTEQREKQRKDAVLALQTELGADYKPTMVLVERLYNDPKYSGSEEDSQALDALFRGTLSCPHCNKSHALGNHIPLTRFIINIARDLLSTGQTIPGEAFRRETQEQSLKKEYPLSYQHLA